MVCVYCAVRTDPETNVEVIIVFKVWNGEQEVCGYLRITVNKFI